MTIFERSRANEAQLTLFAAVSPARTSARPARGRAWTAIDPDCGLSSREPYAIFDPDTQSWRTRQCCFPGVSIGSSLTLMPAGMMRSGRLYRRVPWVTHTCDEDCSLWPTPTASMDGRGFGIPLHNRSGRYKLATILRVHELVLKHGWRIHPHFTETLMGLPLDHSAITQSEMPSSRKSSKRSGGR